MAEAFAKRAAGAAIVEGEMRKLLGEVEKNDAKIERSGTDGDACREGR